jgi:hypothetical protein
VRADTTAHSLRSLTLITRYAGLKALMLANSSKKFCLHNLELWAVVTVTIYLSAVFCLQFHWSCDVTVWTSTDEPVLILIQCSKWCERTWRCVYSKLHRAGFSLFLLKNRWQMQSCEETDYDGRLGGGVWRLLLPESCISLIMLYLIWTFLFALPTRCTLTFQEAHICTASHSFVSALRKKSTVMSNNKTVPITDSSCIGIFKSRKIKKKLNFWP